MNFKLIISIDFPIFNLMQWSSGMKAITKEKQKKQEVKIEIHMKQLIVST